MPKGLDLMIILVVGFVLFGSTLLPRLARSWGKAAEELKSEVKTMRGDSSTEAAEQAQH